MPPSEAKFFCGREVVDVELGRVDGDAAGRARRVDDGERAGVAGDPRDRRHDAGRGLVVRPGVHVDARRRPRGSRASRRRPCARRAPRATGAAAAAGELRAELAERAELRAPFDEAGCRGIPERGRAAVAEHDLVAVGQARRARRARCGRDPPGPSRAPGGATCRGGADPAAARCASCSGRTFDGPQPNRPSAGSRSLGITRLGMRTSLARGRWPLGWMTGCDTGGLR